MCVCDWWLGLSIGMYCCMYRFCLVKCFGSKRLPNVLPKRWMVVLLTVITFPTFATLMGLTEHWTVLSVYKHTIKYPTNLNKYHDFHDSTTKIEWTVRFWGRHRKVRWIVFFHFVVFFSSLACLFFESCRFFVCCHCHLLALPKIHIIKNNLMLIQRRVRYFGAFCYIENRIKSSLSIVSKNSDSSQSSIGTPVHLNKCLFYRISRADSFLSLRSMFEGFIGRSVWLHFVRNNLIGGKCYIFFVLISCVLSSSIFSSR